ncbi:retrovirus-related pol polyprotein from transposon TNT 1-94 [Tanacetum coccineum]
MSTLAKFMILSSGDNRPPMLDKDLYDSWKSRMELYMQNREHGRMILESIKHDPLIWPTIEENKVTRTKKYAELSATEKIQADCDIKVTNIILQGLPSDVYSLVNHHRVSKDLWERVQLLMQDLHTTNFDQLHAYLEQHQLHANEIRIMRESNQDPLALVANHQMTPSHFNTYQSSYNNPQFQQQFLPSQSPQYGLIHPTQHYSTTYPSTPLVITYLSTPYPNAYSSIIHQDACPQPQFIPQIEYTVFTVNQQTHLDEFPQIDSGLTVHVFKQGDDLIDAINKMMSFLSTIVTSRFPTTNNQLRNSSNPRQQATIHDGRVTVQPLQGRPNSYDAGTSGTRGRTSGQQRVVKCFNCQGEGHMARQCLKPKRKRDATWFRDKVLLVEAHENGKVLNEQELDILADPGIVEVALMANLSCYGLGVLSKVSHSDNTHNDMLNQSVQEMSYSEQTHLVNYTKNKITNAMILSVFEQLSNQVTNSNKVNKDNLIANESLSAELERYKEQVKLLEERQNVDLSTREKLIIDDIIRKKNAQFVDFEKEINSLKQTLSEQLKEKESLTTTFNVFKNESKEKEAKNIHKEIALEKLMLYDGTVIAKETNMISIVDSEETLILEEVSRSKMLAKQNNPISKEKKVNITPINYDELNKLSEDFGQSFVPQQEVSAKQAFWFNMSNPSTESSVASHVKVEVPSELPKVSLVNESLKKLKFHLAKFDSVVKIRTIPNALTEGEWGFEHTKAIEAAVQQCSVDKQCVEIVKKKLFLENDRLLQKIMSQDVMNSISLNGEFVNVEKQRYKSCDNQNALEIPEYFENNNLKAQLQDKDTTIYKLKEIIKSLRENNKKETVNQDISERETINVELENSVAKLLSENKLLCNEINHVTHVFKDQFDSIKKTRIHTKEQCDSLIDKLNLKSVENEDLKAQIQDKVFVITSLKKDLQKLKGKEIVDCAAQIPIATTIVLGMFKLDLDPLAPRLLQNRDAYIDYLKHTQEQDNILWGIVKQAKAKQPLDNALDFACKHANEFRCYWYMLEIRALKRLNLVESNITSDSNTPVLSSTGLKCSTSTCRSKPTGNKKNDRISQPSSSNIKNKVEAQPRKVNKKNHVVEPICDANVKHTMLNANSQLICVKCKQCMFDANHDVCFLEFVNDVNKRAKSKSKSKQNQLPNIWKPTCHVFTEVGFKWKPTRRVFTLVGNAYPLTRITPIKVMPIKESTPHSVETQKPELKVYSRRPKHVKNAGSSKKAKIVESKNANNSEPNRT